MKKYIIFSLLICMCVLLSSCSLKVNHYIKAYNNVDTVTSVIQITTIYDGDVLVNRLSTHIEKDGQKVKTTIKSQKLAPIDVSEDYIYQENEVYYDANARYTNVDGQWIKEEGEFKASTIKLNLKSDYLEEVTIDSEVGIGRKLKAKVKSQNVSNILNVNDINASDVYLELIINSNNKLVQCNVIYKTESGKDVKITTTYRYDKISITLPII